MRKSEIIETIIAIDPSQSAEDLAGMTVKSLTSQLEAINDRPEENEFPDVEEIPVEIIETVVEEVEVSHHIVVAEGKSVCVKKSILGPGDLVDLPEESISRLMEKGIVKIVEG